MRRSIPLLAALGLALAALPASAQETCTETLSQVVVEVDLVVPAGETCTLDRSRVGNVLVEPGALLVLVRSRVAGNVESDGAVEVSGTRVSGNVEIEDPAGSLTDLGKNTFYGNVSSVGATDLANSKVVGNVIVRESGSLIVPGTWVRGDIYTEDAAFVHLAGVVVNGNVQVDGTQGTACSGKPNMICSSRIGGDIQLDGNLAPFDVGCAKGNRVSGNLRVVESDIPIEYDMPTVIEVRSNTVRGHLQFNANTAALGFFQIVGNRISGNLECQDNSPDPRGGGNRIRGTAQGQCENLSPESSGGGGEEGEGETVGSLVCEEL